MTLGSLFDGSGGFPIAGLMNGITPVWASEVEPFPIRVTTKRIPQMKHYGDVSQISGADIEPVDIITFGSPCQDLSVAGKREGIEGNRSGLFMQAIRIIKEMREKTNGMYPTFAVWENVPGALSSGRERGEDFRIVLESFCKIIDHNADVPRPEKWSNAGEILGDGYSIAWRILDAQYWGVPQRRRRIFLVADFAGGRAKRILFKPESVSRDFEKSQTAWQGFANDTGNGTCSANQEVYDARGNGDGKTVNTLTGDHENRITDYTSVVCEAPYTMKIRCGCEGGGKGALIQKDKSATIATNNDQILFEPVVALEGNGARPSHQGNGYSEDDVSLTLNATEQHGVAYGIDRATYNMGQNARFGISVEQEVEPTIVAKGPGAVAHPVYSTSKNSYHTEVEEDIANTLVATDYKDPPTVSEDPYYIVRRLTPTECARLQGFPDWWCSDLATEEPTEQDLAFWREVFDTYARINEKKPRSDKQILKWLKNPHTDSAEYKMWGNGVALPCVDFVIGSIADVMRKGD